VNLEAKLKSFERGEVDGGVTTVGTDYWSEESAGRAVMKSKGKV
jgi:hypothetical protein